MSLHQAGRRGSALLLVIGIIVGISACNSRYGASLDRPDDPVVMTGAQLPKLLGGAPHHVVGFSWDGSAWHQIPVQVDERDLVSPGQIYHVPASDYPTLHGTTTPYKVLVYTPPTTLTTGYTSSPTYTPADSDPTLDANDEVSFLAYDTGQKAGAGAGTPAGVDASTRQLVTAADPLTGGSAGYVYLFHSDTLTGGSAGSSGVAYTFSLDSGSYLDTYKMGPDSLAPNGNWGYNPEHSTVVTDSYSQSLTDRWENTGLAIIRVGADGSDLLDRSRYFVTGLGCQRTENTFDGGDQGKGAFIVNIGGPVRAIRSSMGANSFLFTVVTDTFYPSREDTTINLVGHAGMPGFASADDLTTGLTGMTYTDSANTAIPIDGVLDNVTPYTATTGPGSTIASWQLIQGSAGSLVTIRTLDTDISGLTVRTVYSDRSLAYPCTGDTSDWGVNGLEINASAGGVPITDPTLASNAATFVSHRIRYMESPYFEPAKAPSLLAGAQNPIATSVEN